MQYDYHSCPYEPDTGVPPLRGNGRVQNLRMVQSCGHIRKVERWRRSHKRPPPSFPVSNLSYAQVVLKVLAIV